LEVNPVLDHEKSQIREIRVRAEHVVHQHEINLVAAVESLTACKDGTCERTLDDAESRVRDEACPVLIIVGFGVARDLFPEDVPIPFLAEGEGVSVRLSVEMEPEAESREVDPLRGIAKAKLDEKNIIVVPFELKGREKLPGVHLVAIVLKFPEFTLESNPRRETEEFVLNSERA
jgi:hypothetical protein